MKKLNGVGFRGARVLRWPASAISRRCTLLLVGTAYSGCVGSVPVVVYSCGAHRQALEAVVVTPQLQIVSVDLSACSWIACNLLRWCYAGMHVGVVRANLLLTANFPNM